MLAKKLMLNNVISVIIVVPMSILSANCLSAQTRMTRSQTTSLFYNSIYHIKNIKIKVNAHSKETNRRDI